MPEAGRPRTILYMTPSVRPAGARISMMELVRRLDPGRWQPHLVAPERGPVSESFEELGYPVHVIFFRGWWKGKFWPNHPVAVARLTALVHRIKADLIHSNEFWSAPFAILAGRLARVPVVVHFRSSRTPPQLTSKKLRRYLVDRADRVIAIARPQLSLLDPLPRLAGHVELVPNGVDTDRFHPPLDPRIAKADMGLSPDAPVIGIAGLISPHKGHMELLEALALLRPRFPQVRLLIAGSSNPPEYLRVVKQRARELNLNGAISFLGFRQDMHVVLKALDVLATPSHEEAFGRVNIEAAACGVPVVATRVGGIPDVVEEGRTGLLVPVKDPGSLAEALARLLADAELRRSMGGAARDRTLAYYSMPLHAQRIQEIYERVLIENPPRHAR